MRHHLLTALIALLFIAPATMGMADDAASDGAAKAASKAQDAPIVVEQDARVRTDTGETIAYTVRAGETFIEAEDDTPAASIFSVAYLKKGEDDPRTRPVMFVFNGGPGSSSVWLHMGVFGPKKVVLPSDPEDDGAAPFDIRANPFTALDVTDLVFIDPVGTGWSRALGDTDPKDYWGVRKDARSLGRFIRKWLTENGRWNSPKYVAGESYGTTRAAALVNELQGGWTDVSLNGVILVSAILDFQTARSAPGNDTAHIAFLPTMAATAWYHDKIDKGRHTLESFVEEVREFAITDYATALLRGTSMSPRDQRAVAERLAAYTGLSEGYILRANLRLDWFKFMKELLREEGLTVGRLDSRFTGVDYDGTDATFEADPSGFGIDAAYTAAINDYLTRELGVPITRDFQVLSGNTFANWDWHEANGSQGWPAYVNVAPWLGTGMRQNKDLRVLLMSGYYDLATPFFGAELSLMKNGVPYDRVTRTYYPAGHMMYIHHPSLEAMAHDLRDFVLAGD